MKERGCNPFNTKGLIGLDDGQGMLKVGFTLIEVRNFCDTLLICFVNIDTKIVKYSRCLLTMVCISHAEDNLMSRQCSNISFVLTWLEYTHFFL